MSSVPVLLFEFTTVTVQVAFLLPSCVVTVIIAEPTFFPVIFPALLTATIDSSLEVQFTILFVALVGLNVGVSVSVSPSFKVFVDGTEIPSNAISGSKLSTNI